MPPRPLPQVPDGSNLFIDSNILVYAIEQRSAECRTLLERCSREEITGICSYGVVVEATYQFLISEARKKGHLPAEGGRPYRFLNENPAVIQELVDYWTDAQRIFALNLLFLETEEQILRQAQVERHAAGLLPMDSVIAASMRVYDIQMLATNDAAFSRMNGIDVFGPTDI